MALNNTRIRNTKKGARPYRLTDGKGLYVEIRPSGAKLWRYRYRINGRENVYAIGEYFDDSSTPGHMSIDVARNERAKCRLLVRQGIHPIQEKRTLKLQRAQAAQNSFRSVADEWLQKHASHWSAGHAKYVQRVLEKDVFPDVGALTIDQVKAAHILPILDRVAARGAAVVAINIRIWCSGIFAHAVRTLRAAHDPTTVLKGHIKRPAVQHRLPLTRSAIRQLRTKLELFTGAEHTRIALQLLLYLFVRPGELRRAEWTEFDLDAAVWAIPSHKMKKRERHLVPLSIQSVELVRQLRKLNGQFQFLFPNERRPKECMAASTLNMALKRLGYGGEFTAHGFRATASTELHEMGYRSELIEFQLAHAERNATKASYNHAQYWAERRQMMQTWADCVDAWARSDEQVVPMHGRTDA